MIESVQQIARQVIETEAMAVGLMTSAINADFENAVRLIVDCKASVLTSGVGKAGHVARKISATFSSTGTPSHFLSAGDAVHGDLGAVRQGDVVIIFSASGESDEILRLLSLLKKLNHPVIAVTSSRTNTLGRFANAVLAMGKIEEACPLGLAPSRINHSDVGIGRCIGFDGDEAAKFHE